ncbi:MAG: DUF547 domain-containing protein [Opitutaceae bacterium]
MKLITLFFGFLAAFNLVQAEVDYAVYEQLLQKYVEPSGVRYEAWMDHSGDVNALNGVLSIWSKVAVDELSEADQKAFYINLYNAGMLQAVFENYPLKSVKNIGLIPFSIFNKNFIYQAGQKLSLDDIEKRILLKDYFDPRIHFAVNCASESCPPLRAEPYCGAKLEAQLDEQTRLFAESVRAVRKNTKGRNAYSELFNWYDGDFPGEHPAQYLNQYRSTSLPVDEQFDWIPYDWSLNEVR